MHAWSIQYSERNGKIGGTLSQQSALEQEAMNHIPVKKSLDIFFGFLHNAIIIGIFLFL